MAGIGPTEVVIIFFVGLVLVALPVAVVAVVFFLFKNRNAERELLATLREDNKRLREELKDAKAKNG